MALARLPRDCILLLLSKLSYVDLCKLRQVAKFLCNALEDKYFLEKYYRGEVLNESLPERLIFSILRNTIFKNKQLSIVHKLLCKHKILIRKVHTKSIYLGIKLDRINELDEIMLRKGWKRTSQDKNVLRYAHDLALDNEITLVCLL